MRTAFVPLFFSFFGIVGCGDDAGVSFADAASDALVPDAAVQDGSLSDGPGGATEVTIPAGSFWMGCHGIGVECGVDESPYHQVTLSEFAIDVTEVTVEAYERCVDAGACTTPGAVGEYNWGFEERATHPVNCVSWDQAQAYCVWAGKRLPTEAEWEKAARGEDGRIYPWGDEAPDCSRTNFEGCVDRTAPVGSYQAGASPYGALDMAGNVWEWVSDWYARDYYDDSPETDPPGPDAGTVKVLRGASWNDGSESLRTSWRGGDYPDTGDLDEYGFRCASDR